MLHFSLKLSNKTQLDNAYYFKKYHTKLDDRDLTNSYFSKFFYKNIVF